MLFLKGGEGCLLFTAFWWPIRQPPQLWGALRRSNESFPLPSSYEELRCCFQNIAASIQEVLWAACKPPWDTSICARSIWPQQLPQRFCAIYSVLTTWGLVVVPLKHDKNSYTGCCVPGCSFCTAGCWVMGSLFYYHLRCLLQRHLHFPFQPSFLPESGLPRSMGVAVLLCQLFAHHWALPFQSLPWLALHALQGFFLDLFVFFLSQSKYFPEVSNTVFLTSCRLPAGFLLLWNAPFGVFLSWICSFESKCWMYLVPQHGWP